MFGQRVSEGHGVRSFREERSFGLAVGGVATALGAWWLYRHRFEHVAPWVLGGGVLLLALGILAPGRLVHANRVWMSMAQKLSWVSTRLILALVFFLVVTPIGLLRRLSGADPLRRRKPGAGSFWSPYPSRRRDPRHFEKSF